MSFNVSAILSSVLVAVLYVTGAEAHGRMLDPPSRSSMWRLGYDTPKNYNDNQLFCGGFNELWGTNGGRCGVCGDAYNRPRDNEAGGVFATGRIGRKYREGQRITVTLGITMNHGGWFEFRVCPTNDPSRRATEPCLDKHLLAQPNGRTRWQLPFGHPGNFSVNLVLPRGLTCSQCVFQWVWNTASNWGCDTSGCGRGHGAQEQFRNCADVSITSATNTYPGTESPNPGPVNTPAPNSFPGVGNSNNGPVRPIGINPVLYAVPRPVTQRPTTRRPATTTTTTTTQRQTTRKPEPVSTAYSTPGMATGFLPIGMASARCMATPGFKLSYQWADQWCETQCANGNCPAKYCRDECRVAHVYSDQALFG